MKTAIYYPLVDPKNDSLLINSLLYWDEIATIVPDNIQNPYKNPLTAELEILGVLRPEKVNPNSDVVEDVGNEIMDFLESEKATDLLCENGNPSELMYLEKFSPELAHTIRNERMYPGKMSAYVRHRFANENDDGTISVDRKFAQLYMALLAKKIAQSSGYYPITENSNLFNISSSSSSENRIRRNHRERRRWEEEFDTFRYASWYKAMSVNVAIKLLELPEDIKPEKVLQFKEKYRDELFAFRDAMESIKPDHDENMTPAGLINHIESRMQEKILPTLSNLKKSCNGFGMSLVPNTLSTSVTMTVPVAGFFSLSHFSTMESLGLTLAAFLTTSLIRINSDRNSAIKNNPYAYLFHAQNHLQH